MTNQDQAAIALHQAQGDMSLSRCNELAQALADAGLLMPDLPEPHITNLSGSVSATFKGAGCIAPTDQYSPQFITIFGDKECSDATLDAGERLTAIKPDDLDKLIACLLTARNLMHKEQKQCLT